MSLRELYSRYRMRKWKRMLDRLHEVVCFEEPAPDNKTVFRGTLTMDRAEVAFMEEVFSAIIEDIEVGRTSDTLIDWHTTQRGFARGEFKDQNGDACSVQTSSASVEDGPYIWLGCDHETVDQLGNPCGARMHLSRTDAKSMATILTKFADTGKL